MDVMIAIGMSALVLFLLAYSTKRRFGVLGLALAAGYVLSKLWEDSIPVWSTAIAMDTVIVDTVTILTLLIILLPSLLLLLGGPVYKTKRGRIVGSLLYAILAIVFSLGALEYSLVLMGAGRIVFETLVNYQQYILTLALGMSVVDIMYARSSKSEKPDKKH